MVQVRSGLAVFRQPRLGGWAALMQLSAWAVQLLACYVLLVALGLDGRAGIGAAAAVLFAVNVTAALPATPSNLGVFQAACVAVLSAYGVGKTDALAYGIILQAVEIGTALAMGMPALVREGMTWKDLRLRALHSTPVELRRAAATPPRPRARSACRAGSAPLSRGVRLSFPAGCALGRSRDRRRSGRGLPVRRPAVAEQGDHGRQRGPAL